MYYFDSFRQFDDLSLRKLTFRLFNAKVLDDLYKSVVYIYDFQSLRNEVGDFYLCAIYHRASLKRVQRSAL